MQVNKPFPDRLWSRNHFRCELDIFLKNYSLQLGIGRQALMIIIFEAACPRSPNLVNDFVARRNYRVGLSMARRSRSRNGESPPDEN